MAAVMAVVDGKARMSLRSKRRYKALRVPTLSLKDPKNFSTNANRVLNFKT